MSRYLYFGSGLSADTVIGCLYPSRWSHLVIAAYTLFVLTLALRLIWRPERTFLATALPHLATAPIIIASALSFIALMGDLTHAGPPQPHYSGMGAVWPMGLSRILYLVPISLVSYLVLLPLSLIAAYRARSAESGPAHPGSTNAA